jgi:hypothetical protein
MQIGHFQNVQNGKVKKRIWEKGEKSEFAFFSAFFSVNHLIGDSTY